MSLHRRFTLVVLSACVMSACAGARAEDDDTGDDVPPDARPRVDAGPLPDAPPFAEADAMPGQPDASSPDAAPCTPTWQDILVNGNFEGGTTGWTENPAGIVVNSVPPGADTPTFAAWLGGVFNGNDNLTQAVVVPADAEALRVTGKRFVATEEDPGGSEFDKLDVLLLDSASTQLEAFQHLSDNSAQEAWVPFDVMAGSAHAGQTVRLNFHATTDDSFNTNFFIDTVTLQVLRCP